MLVESLSQVQEPGFSERWQVQAWLFCALAGLNGMSGPLQPLALGPVSKMQGPSYKAVARYTQGSYNSVAKYSTPSNRRQLHILKSQNNTSKTLLPCTPTHHLLSSVLSQATPSIDTWMFGLVVKYLAWLGYIYKCRNSSC